MASDKQRVIDAITEDIRTGALAPGEKLLPTRELAEKYEVSEGTLKAAMAILLERGIVRGHPGKGRYVPEEET